MFSYIGKIHNTASVVVVVFLSVVVLLIRIVVPFVITVLDIIQRAATRLIPPRTFVTLYPPYLQPQRFDFLGFALVRSSS